MRTGDRVILDARPTPVAAAETATARQRGSVDKVEVNTDDKTTIINFFFGSYGSPAIFVPSSAIVIRN